MAVAAREETIRRAILSATNHGMTESGKFESELLKATVAQLDAVAALLKLDPSVHAPSPQSSPRRGKGGKGEGEGN